MVQPEADKAKFGGLIPSWHHVDCFLENLESLDASGVTAEELSGFTKLKKETKDELKTKFIPQVKQAKKGCVCLCMCLSISLDVFPQEEA